MPNQDTAFINDSREIAVNLVYNIMEKGAYANLSLDFVLRSTKLNQNDKNLVTEMVNGSIRMIKHLDWVLNLFLKKDLTAQNPWMRSILRMAVYQIMFMERIPDYAAVDEAVGLTRKKTNRALAGVSNAVLRNIIKNKDHLAYPPANSLDYLAVYYSQPEWLVSMWLEQFGQDATEAMLTYMNRKPALNLRVNTLSTDRFRLLQKLAEEGVSALPSTKQRDCLIVNSITTGIDALPSYQAGLFYVQNEAAMLAADILDPQPGEHILDLCSGVGGKATHFAEKMKNRGKIKAVELYEHKLVLLNKNCERLGISIVVPEQIDVLDMREKPIWSRVFLDAPCSGLGVLNRRADARWRKLPHEIRELSQLQLALLEKAGQMTAPGGILLYSTCTVNPAENEQVVRSFLQGNPEFSLDSGASIISGLALDQEDLSMAEQGWLTILPGKYETDGMFYARLRRSRVTNE